MDTPALPQGASSPASPSPPPRDRRSFVLAALVGLAALHLSHPLTVGSPAPELWFPPAGVGLALVAWFGPRAAVLVVLQGLLVALQALWCGWLADGWGVANVLAESVLTAGEILLGWHLYHRVAGGCREFDTPRSATLFLLLIPGVCAAGFAIVRSLPVWLAATERGQAAVYLTSAWLAHALGMLVVAPALLVSLTPWLCRRGLAVPEAPIACREAGCPTRERGPTSGDWVETAGLAIGAGGLGLVLVVATGRSVLDGWQLWGAPVLLIVWASLRQGLRGGTLTAAAAAAIPLVALARWPHLLLVPLLFQTNLLAQCAIALLIASAVHWIRVNEARYRQVVNRVPVVIYSARFLPPTLARGVPPAEVVFLSPACRDVLGCEPEELVGPHRLWLDRVHPDDRVLVEAAIAQLARQNQPVTCEYRLAGVRGQGPGVREEEVRGQWSEDRNQGEGVSGVARASSLTPARWVRDTLAPRVDVDGHLVGWEGVVTDINEQRVLADDLRRTTSMFHALVGNLPAGVFFVQGVAGRPVLVNARARQLLGQREDASAGLEHLSVTYRLFRPDGTRYPVEELPVTLALRERTPAWRDDIVVHRADGRHTPLVSWAAPVEMGREPAAVWVLEDLTALHQAEAARRDSETRLRTVIDTMAEGLVVLDSKGVVLNANPTAADLLGHEPDAMRGRPLMELGHQVRQETGEALAACDFPAAVVLRTGRPIRHAVLSLTPAGTPIRSRWVRLNALPLGTGTPPPGVVLTLADVSAQVEARQAAQASEERYRHLVENLPLMVVQADRDLRVTYVNPSLQAITGYGLADLGEAAAWQEVVYPDDRPRLVQTCRDGLEGRPGRLEVRYTAKDGADRACLVLVQPRLENEEIVGLTGLILDVTRERQLEQDLQRAQRLELVGRLASGVAHDFNNLLSVVMTLTALARGSLPTDHPVHEDLRRIAETSEQAARLAGQLLNFGKHHPARPTPVEVNGVVRRTLDLLRATLPASIEIASDLADGDLSVRGDATQLQQVLMNLCLNARDAMPRGGRLAVRTSAASSPPGLNGAANGKAAGWVVLGVEDTGDGIDEDIRPRLFEPFATTKERGTGLGLAVVQQIVESYGGQVTVRSETGQGARFEVWLPATHSVHFALIVLVIVTLRAMRSTSCCRVARSSPISRAARVAPPPACRDT